MLSAKGDPKDTGHSSTLKNTGLALKHKDFHKPCVRIKQSLSEHQDFHVFDLMIFWGESFWGESFWVRVFVVWARMGLVTPKKVEQDLTEAFSRSPGRRPRWQGRGWERGSRAFASSPW